MLFELTVVAIPVEVWRHTSNTKPFQTSARSVVAHLAITSQVEKLDSIPSKSSLANWSIFDAISKVVVVRYTACSMGVE